MGREEDGREAQGFVFLTGAQGFSVEEVEEGDLVLVEARRPVGAEAVEVSVASTRRCCKCHPQQRWVPACLRRLSRRHPRASSPTRDLRGEGKRSDAVKGREEMAMAVREWEG
jgi:hypothetical protein